MINVLQLAAGQGSRFLRHTDVPKPFIMVGDTPMFKLAYDSLGLEDVRYHIVCQEKHIDEYHPADYAPEAIVHTIDHYTDGAATTAYTVISQSEYKHEQWLVIDCDFVIEWSGVLPNSSGTMVQHYPWDTKSSYTIFDDDANVLGVAEKQPISQYRNTGQYLFETGDIFCEAYKFYHDNNLRSEGEFYISPLYNYIVQQGYIVKALPIISYAPIGTPQDLIEYETNLNI